MGTPSESANVAVRSEQVFASIKGDSKPTALDELFLSTLEYRHSDTYQKLLQFVSRFPKYAPFNGFLLFMQNPEISFVATRDQWWNRFERRVREGARALVILAPMSPVAFVYDLADTDGRRLPRELEHPFETVGDLSSTVWEHTLCNCRERDRIVVMEKQFSPLHAGTARTNTAGQPIMAGQQRKAKRIVELNNQLTREQKYATLVHELAHIHCGHIGDDADGWWPDRRQLTLEQMEFEAESVSFLVCTRLQTEDDIVRVPRRICRIA